MPYYLVCDPHGLEPAHRVYYDRWNAGAPHRVLFTMGLGGTSGQWEPQTSAMAARRDAAGAALFDVVAFDNRGMGFSDPVPGRWTTTLMARDALALLRWLGWTERVHGVGLCAWAGGIAGGRSD